jgi:uncharacterized coiled-coil protein SlyX
MPWKPRLARKLREENVRLTVALARAQERLQSKENRLAGLEILVQQRCKTIDNLNNKLAQIREQNRRLDRENSRLMLMIQFVPAVDAATPAPE